MNEFVDFKKWNIPLKIEYAENKGRYVIATQDIEKESRIVAIKGYSTGVIDSYKKKICSVCLLINNEGIYDISCKSCNMCYYCSKICQMYAQRKLNHDMICPLLRRLGTFKSDFHSKSIMKLLLNSLAIKKSEEVYLNQNENIHNNRNKFENIENFQRSNINNDNNNWLSLVPLQSDIEKYEKEIEVLEKSNIINENEIESNKDEQANNELNEIGKEKEKDDTFSSDDENILKKKKKDKIKKKNEDKDKDKKRHRQKKNKKEKKEEYEGIYPNIDNNKEKSKHKHSKHHKNNEGDIKEVEDKNENIKEEITETNTDKYDIITNTIPYSGNFKDLMNLQSHFEEWTEDMKKEWQKNINFFKKLIQESKEISNLMEKVVEEYICDKRNKENTIFKDYNNNNNINSDIETENYIMSFASLVESNSFGIWNNKEKCIGRIIYPFASYFNHSCSNNCYPIQYKNHIYFYALRDIKEGEEVNFSYIDTKGVSLKDRQAHLLADYYFKCQCELCCKEEYEISLISNSKKSQKKKDKKKK